MNSGQFKPIHSCSRCGAQITNVFRVGGLTFGSDCIFKITAEWIAEHYPSNAEKAAWAFSHVQANLRVNKKLKTADYPLELIELPF